MDNNKNFKNSELKEYQREIEHGGKFIIYNYCFSIIIMTFKQSSSVFFVKGNESRTFKGLGYTFFTLFLGWWGLPWGPIYTIQTLFRNLRGGIDVTDEVMAEMMQEID